MATFLMKFILSDFHVRCRLIVVRPLASDIDRGHTAGHTLGAHFSTSLGVPDIVELCSVSSKSLIYKDFGGFGGKLS